MTNLPVKPGIDGIPTNLIPTDPTAFVEWFKNSFLPRWAANADARNAIPTSGSVVITGDTNTPAGIGIGPNSVTNGELVQRSPLSVMGNPTGVTGNVQDIVAPVDGDSLQRVGGALVWAPASATVSVADSITGLGTLASPLKFVNDSAVPGTSQYYGTDVTGTLGYFPILSSNIQTFVQGGGTSQTYTIPITARKVDVICIGGGGGGGSGMLSASGTCGGGGGGAGGGISFASFRAADLGVSQTITFTSTGGGAGGAATTSTSGGNAGTVGARVTFGNLLSATGGGAGGGALPGGNGSAGTGAATANSSPGGNGGQGPNGNTGIAGATPILPATSCTGGGGGGGVTHVGPASFAGGAGGSSTFAAGNISNLAGGTAGALAGGGGSNGTLGSGLIGSTGGGGGGGTVTTSGTAGSGGNGGGFGAGGGGGGSGLSTSALSGAGGTGGVAACICIAY